jgi:hypothetical protein
MHYDQILKLATNFEALAKKKKKKKSKKPSWKDMPEGWEDSKSVKKYWKSLTEGDEHPFAKCVEKMKGKMKKPEGFCAKTKDVSEGGTGWRGKERKKNKKKSKKKSK